MKFVGSKGSTIVDHYLFKKQLNEIHATKIHLLAKLARPRQKTFNICLYLLILKLSDLYNVHLWRLNLMELVITTKV